MKSVRISRLAVTHEVAGSSAVVPASINKLLQGVHSIDSEATDRFQVNSIQRNLRGCIYRT